MLVLERPIAENVDWQEGALVNWGGVSLEVEAAMRFPLPEQSSHRSGFRARYFHREHGWYLHNRHKALQSNVLEAMVKIDLAAKGYSDNSYVADLESAIQIPEVAKERGHFARSGGFVVGLTLIHLLYLIANMPEEASFTQALDSVGDKLMIRENSSAPETIGERSGIKQASRTGLSNLWKKFGCSANLWAAELTYENWLKRNPDDEFSYPVFLALSEYFAGVASTWSHPKTLKPATKSYQYWRVSEQVAGMLPRVDSDIVRPKLAELKIYS